jgi:hypothetical protein
LKPPGQYGVREASTQDGMQRKALKDSLLAYPYKVLFLFVCLFIFDRIDAVL